MDTDWSRCNSTSCSRYYTCRRAQMISNTFPTDYADTVSEITGKYACGCRGGYKMYEPMDTTVPFKEEELVGTLPVFNLYEEYPPTHQCNICEEIENPKASLATSEFWICPTCLEKLRFVLNNVVIKEKKD